MSLFVEATIPSGIGNAALAITSATHISVTLDTDVKGVHYAIHGHYSMSYGKWTFGDDSTNFSMRRVWNGKSKDFDKPAAPTHVAAAKAALKEALDAYLVAHPSARVSAEIKRLEREMKSVQGECAELAGKLLQANTALADLMRQHEALVESGKL